MHKSPAAGDKDHQPQDGCCVNRSSAATESLDEVFFSSAKSVHKAVLTSNVERIAALLERRPADVRALDSAGYAPILYVKDCKVLDMLMRYGADVDACTPEGRRTLLHRASLQGNCTLVKQLLDHGARIDLEDAEGNTAQSLAHGKEIVELLT